jgi:hypothetical protein
VPEDWPLDETRLILDLGGESLVTLDDGEGKLVRFGLDPNHREFPLKTRHRFRSGRRAWRASPSASRCATRI